MKLTKTVLTLFLTIEFGPYLSSCIGFTSPGFSRGKVGRGCRRASVSRAHQLPLLRAEPTPASSKKGPAACQPREQHWLGLGESRLKKGKKMM